MSVSRVAIEHALDAIASDEGGMGFQGLAVVLAKLRWPELIACERKWDLGLDAHAPAILSLLLSLIHILLSVVSAGRTQSCEGPRVLVEAISTGRIQDSS